MGAAVPEPDPVPEGPQAPKKTVTPAARKRGTVAQIVLESDMMRSGSDALLLDISTGFLTLRSPGKFAPDDQIKIRLRNDVQRCQKETRGTIRTVDTSEDGSSTFVVELFTRLTPLEVSMLKMGVGLPDVGESGSKWV